MLIPTALLGSFIWSFLHACWISFWLTQDSAQVMATIVSEKSHGVVGYNYVVAGREYTGQGQRSRNQYQNVHLGERSLVFFSSSHPWFSSLETPAFPPSGLIVFTGALLMEMLFVMTVITPKGKWALQTGLNQKN